MSLTAPTDIPGCVVWLDALTGVYADAGKTTPATPGDPVACWANRVPGGPDATQATGGNRPTLAGPTASSLGRPGLLFNGTSSYLTFGQPTAWASLSGGAVTGYTVYARLVWGLGVQAPYGTIYSHTGGQDNLLAHTNNNNSIQVNAAANFNAPGAKVSGDLVTAAMRYAPTDPTLTPTDQWYTVWQDDYYAQGRFFSHDDAVDYLIGATPGPSSCGNFTLVDFCLFNRPLSADEKATLDAYYRLRDGEPATFPYRLGVDGNSIYWGQADPSENGFARRAKAALGVPSYAYFNAAVRGQTMAAMLSDAASQIDPALTQFAGPTYLLFAEGVNELQAGTTSQQSHDAAASYGAGRRAAGNPNVRLMTATIPPNGFSPAGTNAALNALLRADSSPVLPGSIVRVPNPGVTWFDLMVDFAADPYLAVQANTVDGTHWSSAGHQAGAAILFAGVRAFSLPLTLLDVVGTIAGAVSAATYAAFNTAGGIFTPADRATLGTLGTATAAVKAKTDQLTFTTPNRLDATALAVSDKSGYGINPADAVATAVAGLPSAAANATALLDAANGIETGWTVRQALRTVTRFIGSKTANKGGTIRDLADTKDAIVATVDANGNRTAVVVDKA